MTDSNETNPLVEMIRRIRLDIFQRLRQGKVNYKADMATLEKHLDIAEELSDQRLVIQTYNAMGIVEDQMGHFTAALEYLQEGHHRAVSLDDHRLMGSSQINMSEVYRRMGRLQDAVAACEAAVLHASKSDNQRTRATAQNNLGLTWLALGELDKAEQCFNLVWDITKDERWDHISTLVETHNGLAEVYLAHRELEAAWQQVVEAESLAAGRELYILLAQTQIVKAHIAEADPDHQEEARDYYNKARELLREQGTPVNYARMLLEEARYQQRHGQTSEVIRLATEAQEMFLSLELTDDASIAERLIKAPDTVA